jgi:diadenosine tetraphosphate (Ap4A) HIT family hydrolase
MPQILHPLLAKEALPIASLGVCRLYLRNVCEFPWLLLVPMREDIREIYDLNAEDYEQTMAEVRAVTKHFAEITGADKMNVAAFGNIVPQLHIHIIARFENDPIWPQPAWNLAAQLTPYSTDKANALIGNLRAVL